MASNNNSKPSRRHGSASHPNLYDKQSLIEESGSERTRIDVTCDPAGHLICIVIWARYII